jgi:hypothetical protein
MMNAETVPSLAMELFSYREAARVADPSVHLVVVAGGP